MIIKIIILIATTMMMTMPIKITRKINSTMTMKWTGQ